MSAGHGSAALAADPPADTASAPRAPRVGRPPIELSLGPSLVMPAQWFAGAAATAALQPEKRLMLAVLADAVEILARRGGAADLRSRQLVAETARWIESEDRAWPYSFLNLCDALGLDPGCVRRGLARVRDAGTAAAARPAPIGAR